MNSKRPLIIGLAIAAAIFVIAAVIVLVLILTRVPFKSAHNAPKLMPADTSFFTSMTVDLQDVTGFKHLEDIYGSEVEGFLDDILDELEDELDVTWEDDIRPWLGSEVGIGIADLESAMESGEPTIIAMAATRKQRASDEFIEKVVDYLDDDDYYDVQDEEYQGVAYWVAEPDSDWDMPLVLGTVGKFVVLTSDEDAMEDVIRAESRDIDTLDREERFKQLTAALPSGAVLYSYIDLGEIVDPIMDEMGAEAEYELGIAMPDEIYDYLEALEAVGFSVSLDRQGVQLDMAMTFDPDEVPAEMLEGMSSRGSANRILRRIPDNVLGFFSGQDLASGWESLYDGLMELEDAEEMLDDFGDEVGIDIDRELFDWLSGEFAIAVTRARGPEDIPVGGLAIMEVDDQDKAEDTLDSFVDVLRDIGDIELDDQDFDDVEMQVIIDPGSEEIVVGYGFMDKHLIMGIFEDSLEDAVAAEQSPISSDPAFQAVQRHLPSGSNGYFYISLENVLDVVTDALGDWEREDYEDYVEPWVDPIKALGIAGEPVDTRKGVMHAVVFVYVP